MNRPIEFSGNKMKTSELIEQAEIYLIWNKFSVGSGIVRELIDRFKKHEEALLRLACYDEQSGFDEPNSVRIARKALGDE